MDTHSNSSAGTAARRNAMALVAASILLASGCAYFNTFYNAKAEFKRADDERKQGGSGAAGFQKSIEKSQLLMRYYPDSKYVDDALFLMGMARFHRGEYVQARAAFEDLFDRFPKSEYIERARYWNGYAALRQGDVGAAAQAFERLASDFPDSKLNVEAVFRQAEARLDARDYDRARDDLRVFMVAHPKSEFAAEAQLRLARTFLDEKRYAEAREEYARLLEMGPNDAVRYEAELNAALALRAIAEEVLSDPALQTARLDSSAVAAPTPAVAAPTAAADSTVAADTTAVTADSTAVAADSPAAADSPVASVPAPAALTAEQTTTLAQARAQIEEVWSRLQSMRKLAAKQGKQTEHEIELAVTRALRGDPENAREDLDQIARLKPKTAISARARFEIGEIHRRAYDLDAARQAYDDASRETNGIPIIDLARRKSAAIGARKSAQERLANAPEVLKRWGARNGARNAPLPAAVDSLQTSAVAAADSVSATGVPDELALATDFEAMAAEQLRVAEIDLLDLDQPLVALREFERVLAEYAGSLQAPRAAFAIAWIYDHRLRDPQRAREAYRSVADGFPESAQGRAAEEILAHWDDPGREVQDPFSRP